MLVSNVIYVIRKDITKYYNDTIKYYNKLFIIYYINLFSNCVPTIEQYICIEFI